MIEKLLNLIFEFDTTFTDSMDPPVEEYRGYQRQMVIALAQAPDRWQS